MAAIKALVVDDDPGTREYLTLLLEQLDFSVRSARDGFIAVEIMNEFRPQLMLLDIGMPVLSGLDVLRLARPQIDRGCRVIMTTASGSRTDVEASVQLGACGYMLKPVTPAVLRRRVEHHLQLRSSPRPDAVVDWLV
jgi:DNA-binding response OmpR family regulator